MELLLKAVDVSAKVLLALDGETLTKCAISTTIAILLVPQSPGCCISIPDQLFIQVTLVLVFLALKVPRKEA